MSVTTSRYRPVAARRRRRRSQPARGFLPAELDGSHVVLSDVLHHLPEGRRVELVDRFGAGAQVPLQRLVGEGGHAAAVEEQHAFLHRSQDQILTRRSSWVVASLSRKAALERRTSDSSDSSRLATEVLPTATPTATATPPTTTTSSDDQGIHRPQCRVALAAFTSRSRSVHETDVVLHAAATPTGAPGFTAGSSSVRFRRVCSPSVHHRDADRSPSTPSIATDRTAFFEEGPMRKFRRSAGVLATVLSLVADRGGMLQRRRRRRGFR